MHAEGQYREYISRIVLRDYDLEVQKIRDDMTRISLAGVDTQIEDKFWNCMKIDCKRVISVKDWGARVVPSQIHGSTIPSNREGLKKAGIAH